MRMLTLPPQPLIRAAYEANAAMTEAEAVALLRKCMQVLFYRDARSINRVCRHKSLTCIACVAAELC